MLRADKKEKNWLFWIPVLWSTPESGMGDYRESAFCVRSNDGYHASELKFKGYEILPGKPVLEGLPATWGSGEDCTTLKLHLEDELLGLKVCLLYTAFEGLDVITRSVLVENAGKEAVYLEKVLSACLDMENREFEAIGLFGGWARERHIQRVPVGYGRQNIGLLQRRIQPSGKSFYGHSAPRIPLRRQEKCMP